jgi:hypothetical protein
MIAAGGCVALLSTETANPSKGGDAKARAYPRRGDSRARPPARRRQPPRSSPRVAWSKLSPAVSLRQPWRGIEGRARCHRSTRDRTHIHSLCPGERENRRAGHASPPGHACELATRPAPAGPTLDRARRRCALPDRRAASAPGTDPGRYPHAGSRGPGAPRAPVAPAFRDGPDTGVHSIVELPAGTLAGIQMHPGDLLEMHRADSDDDSP